MHIFRAVAAAGVVDTGSLTIQGYFAYGAIRSAGVGIGVRFAQLVLAFGTLVITSQTGDRAVAFNASGHAVVYGLADRAVVAAMADIGIPVTVAVIAFVESGIADLGAFFVDAEGQAVVGNETIRAGLTAMVDVVDAIAVTVIAGVEAFVAGGLALTAEAG